MYVLYILIKGKMQRTTIVVLIKRLQLSDRLQTARDYCMLESSYHILNRKNISRAGSFDFYVMFIASLLH